LKGTQTYFFLKLLFFEVGATLSTLAGATDLSSTLVDNSIEVAGSSAHPGGPCSGFLERASENVY
jgi:hypothetical protein